MRGSRAQLKRALGVGGHPFVIRLALWQLTEHNLHLDDLLGDTRITRGPFATHLDHYGKVISLDGSLRRAILQILEEGACDDHQSFERLWSTGLVRRTSGNSVAMRSQLYHDYFQQQLLT